MRTTAALFGTEYEPPSLCHFGILEVGLPALLAGGLEAAGVGATTAGIAGGIGAGALEGAGLGAGVSALTGGDPGKGALTGAITGGAIGAAAPVGAALGVGTTAAGVGLGAAGGFVGAEVTGGDPLKGALFGGGAGLASGLIGGGGAATPGTTVASAPATGTVGGTSAVGAGATAPVGGASPVAGDLTSAGTFYGDPMGATSAGFNFPGSAAAPVSGLTSNPGAIAGDAAATGATGGDAGSKIMGLVEKNPGVLLAGGLLGANMLLGNEKTPAEKAVEQQAGEAGTQARTLTAYQTSGTLPPGLQGIVDQQFDAAKAGVIDSFAKQGLGNSTMMADKLNALKAQKSAEIAQFADMLAKQGIQWANLSSNEFTTLLNAQAQQDSAFTAALGSFAGGLAGLRSGSAKV